MLQHCGIGTCLEEHSNRATPKAYTSKSPSGPLPPDSGPIPKKVLYADTTNELYNTHDLTLVFYTRLTQLHYNLTLVPE